MVDLIVSKESTNSPVLDESLRGVEIPALKTLFTGAATSESYLEPMKVRLMEDRDNCFLLPVTKSMLEKAKTKESELEAADIGYIGLSRRIVRTEELLGDIHNGEVFDPTDDPENIPQEVDSIPTISRLLNDTIEGYFLTFESLEKANKFLEIVDPKLASVAALVAHKQPGSDDDAPDILVGALFEVDFDKPRLEKNAYPLILGARCPN